jgi:hypothetical protein
VLIAGPGRLSVVVPDLVDQDRHKVAVVEPLDGLRGAQRPVARVDVAQPRRRDRAGRLRRDPTHS